jgi:hypothetical protein
VGSECEAAEEKKRILVVLFHLSIIVASQHVYIPQVARGDALILQKFH